MILPTKEQTKIAADAISEMLAKHKTQGGGAAAIATGMAQCGIHAMTSLVAPNEIAAMLKAMAAGVEHGRATPEGDREPDVSLYVENLMNVPSPFDRGILLRATIGWAASALAAISGAETACKEITSVVDQIRSAAADGQFRRGGRLDLN